MIHQMTYVLVTPLDGELFKALLHNLAKHSVVVNVEDCTNQAGRQCFRFTQGPRYCGSPGKVRSAIFGEINRRVAYLRANAQRFEDYDQYLNDETPWSELDEQEARQKKIWDGTDQAVLTVPEHELTEDYKRTLKPGEAILVIKGLP